jgi:hypothetical protein
MISAQIQICPPPLPPLKKRSTKVVGTTKKTKNMHKSKTKNMHKSKWLTRGSGNGGGSHIRTICTNTLLNYSFDIETTKVFLK